MKNNILLVIFALLWVSCGSSSSDNKEEQVQTEDTSDGNNEENNTWTAYLISTTPDIVEGNELYSCSEFAGTDETYLSNLKDSQGYSDGACPDSTSGKTKVSGCLMEANSSYTSIMVWYYEGFSAETVETTCANINGETIPYEEDLTNQNDIEKLEINPNTTASDILPIDFPSDDTDEETGDSGANEEAEEATTGDSTTYEDDSSNDKDDIASEDDDDDLVRIED